MLKTFGGFCIFHTIVWRYFFRHISCRRHGLFSRFHSLWFTLKERQQFHKASTEKGRRLQRFYEFRANSKRANMSTLRRYFAEFSFHREHCLRKWIWVFFKEYSLFIPVIILTAEGSIIRGITVHMFFIVVIFLISVLWGASGALLVIN